MATHSEIAAKLLRDAATFFKSVGEQNAPLEQEMTENAAVYEQIAQLIESDPTGEIDLEDVPSE